MKSVSLYIIFLFLFFNFIQSKAQVITIASARALTAGFAANTSTTSGPVVTVSGIVTNGSEFGTTRYLQDGTGGIAAYGNLLSAIMTGDSIVLTGILSNYNSLLQLNPSGVQLISSGHASPAPVIFNSANIVAAFSEAYEGQLVRLNGNTGITTSLGTAFSTFASNTNYIINGNASTALRINGASTGANGIVGTIAPSGNYDVLGIISQFSSSNTAAGYQFFPRLYNDFILPPAPDIVSSLKAINISTSGITVNFDTQNPGDTKIEYGLTTALGLTLSNAASTNSHNLAISGLSPATVYYIKATSTNGSGSSISAVVPMITASSSTGNIKVYFNNDNVDNSFAFPGNDAIALNQIIDDTLIAYINRAKYSIDIVIYNWININLSDITGAVNSAHARGVQVRVIGNGSTSNAGITSLNAGINKLLSPTTSAYGIMHNKFVVIDAASTNANDPIVWTGSTNWTDQQINADINNVVIIQDQSLAKVYTMEFEEMWGSSTATPNLANSKFGPYKTDNTPHDLNIGGVEMQSYFSPSDDVNTKIIETINSADHEFNFAVMDLTRSDIANAIKLKYNSFPDTCSSGILDDTVGVTGAAVPYFTMNSAMSNRLRIHLDTNIMHSKYIIIDAGNASSDPTVLTGSHNWTNAADQLNDENILIIHDNNIANKYYQNFAAVFGLEGGTSCNYSSPVLAIANANNHPEPLVKIYPNPANADFLISTDPSLNILDFVLINLNGEVVMNKIFYNSMPVDISFLPKGFYFLRLTTLDGLFIYDKLIIE
jgi:phosphatidylserine/phosphatidylglycerophosphate/cardiolipin synthase-like enzyme